MSNTTKAVYFAVGSVVTPVDDDKVALAGGAQAGATPITSEFSRFTLAANATTNSAILKSILSGEAAALVYVINDAANPIQVFCAVGEKMNGVLNASLAVPAGQAAVFVPIPNFLTGGPDWRAAAIA